MAVEDLELVRAAAKGDPSAFHQLVDRHQAHLFRLASLLSRTQADAEDIVQETFAGAFVSLGKFSGNSSVKTWLSRILSRQAARAWNRSRRHRSMVGLDDASESAAHDRQLAVGSATTATDRRLDISTMLATLSDEHRQVLVLRELQGFSYAEIAQTLEIAQGTVESRIHRARAELRKRMEGYVS